MDHLAACSALEDEVDRFASVLSSAPREEPVPTCPEWTVSDLALHLGTVHRWAEHLVRVRAQARIDPADMGLSLGPADEAWIREGAEALVATLRHADPAMPMWAWGADQHAAFWSRRQLHETLVHRIDLELALGIEPHADTTIAVDAIDEFLVNLASAASFSANVKRLRGNGERLAVGATDTDAGWTILLTPDGFSVSAAWNHLQSFDASLTGPALAVLLALYRRWPSTAEGLTVVGSNELADFWLANSALE